MRNYKVKILAFLLIAALPFLANAKNRVKVGLEIGNKAPEIKLLSPQGEVIPLSSLKGKMVLIDFWASWCGPCRRENPHVVEAFKEFKDKKFDNGVGFTVFSVSLDTNKDRWVKAIKADGLIWESHVSDFGGWNSRAAEVYGIRSIPDNFLINGEGIIVAKNLGVRIYMKY